jgi:hypothetical protein
VALEFRLFFGTFFFSFLFDDRKLKESSTRGGRRLTVLCQPEDFQILSRTTFVSLVHVSQFRYQFRKFVSLWSFIFLSFIDTHTHTLIGSSLLRVEMRNVIIIIPKDKVVVDHGG